MGLFGIKKKKGEKEYRMAYEAMESGNKSETIRLFTISAEKGEYKSQYRLAEYYYFGDGVAKNLDEAEKWYNKSLKAYGNESFAAEKARRIADKKARIAMGNQESKAEVLFERGLRLEYTGKNENNPERAEEFKSEAFACFEQSAGLGCTDALLYLGYQQADTAKARESLRKAIEAGAGKTRVAALESFITNKLKEGEEKYLEAQKELKKKLYYTYGLRLAWAADSDHTEAQYELGKALCEGTVGKFDLNAGRGWLQRAAGKGHKSAEEFLQSEYISTIANWEGKVQSDAKVQSAIFNIAVNVIKAGLLDDKDQGIKLVEKLTEYGHLDSMCCLGQLYRGEFDGARAWVDKDINLALSWLNKAAKLGSAEAYYHLANMYWYGNGVKANNYRAQNFYKEAAKDTGDIGRLASDRLKYVNSVIRRDQERRANNNATTYNTDYSAGSESEDKYESGLVRGAGSDTQYGFGRNIDGTTMFVTDESGNRRVVRYSDYGDLVDDDGNHYK